MSYAANHCYRTLASGSSIELYGNAKIALVWNQLKPLLRYRAVILDPPGQPQLVITGTNKVVGTVVPVGPGYIICLPGLRDLNGQTSEELLTSLVSLVEALKAKPGDFELPDWATKFQPGREQIATRSITDLEQRRDQIVEQLAIEKAGLADLEQYKMLFTGTGKPLELVVRRALERLGFAVQEGAEGRDVLIAEYGDRVAVVEVKGTTKSASEAHAAQLEKWVSEYYSTHGRQPKGILVVNAYRDLELPRRTEAAFPSQMLGYSTRREHCLMTGLQLLGMMVEVENHPERRDDLIDLLFRTNGVLSGFEDWRQYLTPLASIATEQS